MKELTQSPSSDTAPLSGALDDRKLGGKPDETPEPPEVRAAKDLARRYRLSFVELLPADQDSPVDFALFSERPVALMVRHQLLPLKRVQNGLHLAMADPTDLERLEE